MSEQQQTFNTTDLLKLSAQKTSHKKLTTGLQRRMRALRIQRFIGWVVILPFCYAFALSMRWGARYKVENMRAIRKRYMEIAGTTNKPLMICSNHLTFIDSCLLIWALAPNWWYFFNYKKFQWNLPAGDFFGKKWYFRLVAYLSKCIFIHRDGPRSHHYEILDVAQALLEKGEVVTVFPEGRRSRTGLFETDKLTYGVGKIIHSMKECQVLCTYVRSDKQKTYSSYPALGSTFHVDFELITPQTQSEGREAYFEILGQIGSTIKKLENNYFETHPYSARPTPVSPVS